MIEMATKNSDQETVVFTCFWRIENFRLGKDIDSPKFRVKMLQNSEWFLTLHSKSNNDAGVYLEKCGKKGCINIAFIIYLLKTDGSNLILVEEENHTFEEEGSWGSRLDQEEISCLLLDVYQQSGTLTLMCHMWNEFTAKHKPVQCSITTRLENERHVFKLPIEKFSSLSPDDERSFLISCLHFGQPQLDMNIHLKVDKEGYFKFSIQKINTIKSSLSVHCKIMTTTKEGLKIQLKRMTVKFQNGYRKHPRHFQFAKKLKINLSSAKEKYDLSDDVLILYCELLVGLPFKALPQEDEEEEEVEEEEAVISNDTKADSTEMCSFSKMDDLMHFFREKKFCYVTLRTANKEFAVHKALLCARSPVFCAMFERDMLESDSNIVDIYDVDSDTISLLLNFLHLEPVVDLKWEAASKLFYAADKYQIEELKSKCVCFLSSELSVENVCEAFLLSDMHHDENLKHNAQKFFCENSKSILRSKEWNEFLMSRTELAGEVLRVLADKL